MRIILIFVLLICFATAAIAHGGGCKKAEKEATGRCCHVETKTETEHCHDAK